MEWMLMPYRRLYALIAGRASRQEFWMFVLFNVIVAVVFLALFMTLIVHENRDQVMGEFKALNALQKAEPQVKLIPGHDGVVVKALTAEGLVTQGFKS